MNDKDINQKVTPDFDKNSVRNLDAAFEALKVYFETQVCCDAGLRPLKEGVEISLRLRSLKEESNGRVIDGALFRKNGKTNLDKRDAKKPDIRFEFTENAVRTVSSYTGADVGQFGIQIVQQIVLGEVRIKILGSVFALMTNGYLGIIKAGGSEFLKVIGEYGFSSLSKFPALIKKLRE